MSHRGRWDTSLFAEVVRDLFWSVFLLPFVFFGLGRCGTSLSFCPTSISTLATSIRLSLPPPPLGLHFLALFLTGSSKGEGSSPEACVEVLASVVRPERIDSKVYMYRMMRQQRSVDKQAFGGVLFFRWRECHLLRFIPYDYCCRRGEVTLRSLESPPAVLLRGGQSGSCFVFTSTAYCSHLRCYGIALFRNLFGRRYAAQSPTVLVDTLDGCRGKTRWTMSIGY